MKPACADVIASRYSVEAVFARARASLGLDKKVFPQSYTLEGILTTSSMQGRIRELHDGDRDEDDIRLGPLTQRSLHIGTHFWTHDGLEITRPLTGQRARSARTTLLLDQDEYLAHPEWISSWQHIHDQTQDVIFCDIQPPGGDRKRLQLDAQSGMLMRVTDSDGRSNVSRELSDWRDVAGVKFPFTQRIHTTAAEIVTQVITSVQVGPLTEPFDLPPSRDIAIEQSVTVPLLVRDDHLYVPVKIDNKDAEFLVDTGSQSTVIDRQFALRLGVGTSGQVSIQGTTAAKFADITRLASLRIGGIEFGPQVAVMTDLGVTSDGTRTIAGILGFSAFAPVQIRLDVAHGRMQIAAPGYFQASGTRVPLLLDRGVPEVQVHLPGGPPQATFVIDTGSSANMLLYHRFVRHYPAVFQSDGMQDRTYGIGGSVPSLHGRVRGLILPHLILNHSLAADMMTSEQGAFADTLQAGSIGMGLLGQYVMTLDAAQGYLELDPIAP